MTSSRSLSSVAIVIVSQGRPSRINRRSTHGPQTRLTAVWESQVRSLLRRSEVSQAGLTLKNLVILPRSWVPLSASEADVERLCLFLHHIYVLVFRMIIIRRSCIRVERTACRLILPSCYVIRRALNVLPILEDVGSGLRSDVRWCGCFSSNCVKLCALLWKVDRYAGMSLLGNGGYAISRTLKKRKQKMGRKKVECRIEGELGDC